jgi:LysR family transcriptional regulator, glycine cleavage system transcriptional activator
MVASLTLLRAFEAAGRTGSFRDAARELNLTPSAVSHAIRSLEQGVGVVLFERAGRSMRLTAEGEALMRHAGRAFEDLRRGLATVTARGPKLLRVHSAPSFAAQWLAPRLSGFLATHPGIEVRLAASTDYARFTTDDFDLDIVYGAPRDGLLGVALGNETVTPLCSPALARSVRRPEDLLGLTRIESDNKRVRWPAWFAANGLPPPPPGGLRFDRSFLAVSVAASGLGVALESTRLAEREIADGRLVAPLAGQARDVGYPAHVLVLPPGSQQREPVRAFVGWMLAELGIAAGFR